MSSNFTSGSTDEFDENWRSRRETTYNHWIKGTPRNQIQLAFKNHFQLFSDYLKRDGITIPGKCLEVGCGRGSISSFFAEAGYSCTLLDMSAAVLDVAKKIFSINGHSANYIVGDANQLDISDETFDVVVSIGLLEHFDDIEKPLREQLRVLKPGGRCLCYVVPEKKDNIQKYFRIVNKILRFFSSTTKDKGSELNKTPIYRAASSSEEYLPVLSKMGAVEIETTGVYPMPMISPSPEFPFTLMHPLAERMLTLIFRCVLGLRSLFKRDHPWTCQEQLGQAFLVTFRKAK